MSARVNRRVAAIAIGIAAICSVAATASAATDQPKAVSDLPTLTVAAPGITASVGAVYVAYELGYFTKAGVNVKILDNQGAQIPNDLVAGQADLGFFGVGSPLLLSSQGKATTIVYSPLGGGSGGMLVGGAGITSLKQLDGKRIGIIGPGSSTTGFATQYNKILKLGADLVPLGTPATQAAALASGQVQAVCNGYDFFSPLIDAGKAQVLVDTRIPRVRHKLLGPDYPEGSIFGLSDVIKQKRGAVISFLRGLDLALRYIRTHPADQVAAVLHGYPAFAPFTVDHLTESVKSQLTYLGLNDGLISKPTWQYALTQYKAWGVGIDPADPAIQYDKEIDMSYAQAALKADAITATARVTKSGAVSFKASAPLTSGYFKITVRDLSKKTGFELQGGKFKKTTGVAFRGTTTWNVFLKPGRYFVRPTRPGQKVRVISVLGD